MPALRTPSRALNPGVTHAPGLPLSQYVSRYVAASPALPNAFEDGRDQNCGRSGSHQARGRFSARPGRRSAKAGKGAARGVAGALERLAARGLSSQPLTGFDWSPDKLGLFACTALDQTLRVGFVTRLQAL